MVQAESPTSLWQLVWNMAFYLFINLLNLSHLKILISKDYFKCSMAFGFCFKAILKIYFVLQIESLLRGIGREDITFCITIITVLKALSDCWFIQRLCCPFLYNFTYYIYFSSTIFAKVAKCNRKRNRKRQRIINQMHRRFSFQRKQNSALRKLFKKIDVDSNGFISRSELRTYLDECCFFRDKQDATNSILQNFDVNQDGYIDFDEFRHIIHTVQKQREDPPSNEELQSVFDLFDADGNHLISFKEFWKQVRLLDASIAKKEAEAMFNDIDEDSDGYIDFGEFLRYLNFPN